MFMLDLDEDHRPIRLSMDDLARNEFDFDAMEKRRRVGDDEVDGVRISTVFLGVELFSFEGPPDIFETMLFGEKDERVWSRYKTWNDAVAGHSAYVAGLRKGISPETISERLQRETHMK